MPDSTPEIDREEPLLPNDAYANTVCGGVAARLAVFRWR